MNVMNDLNIPPDPPETWKAKLSRIVMDYVLPYGVPYVIPIFLAWKYTRPSSAGTEEDETESLRVRLVDMKKQLKNFQGHVTNVECAELRQLKQIDHDLDRISKMLVERQDIFCSPIRRRELREKVERDLRDFAYTRSYEKDLHLYRDLEDILARDQHCGRTKEENGCLMWVYLDLWRTKTRLMAQDRVLREVKKYQAEPK
ncbi:coiled-coil domain-containing protein 127-like [Diadema setosum]|uniref:coiled-coil domain-containing protein 127-like n=1 Tax=Diadema setosum TaxID=31175 RepID=UPI003B3B425E